MRVTVENGLYISQLDLLSKIKSFLSLNGWAVKDGLGDLGDPDPLLRDQFFPDGLWFVAFSNCTGNLNTKWITPEHERIYLIIGQSPSIDDGINISKECINIKVARFANMTGATVPASQVVNHANPSNLEGDDSQTWSGFDHILGSPSYYLITDGSSERSGSFFIIASEQDQTTAKWRSGYFGLGQVPSRITRSLTGSITGSSIDLGEQVPNIWTPSYMKQQNIKLGISNQMSAGESFGSLIVNGTNGNILIVDNIGSVYVDPIISNDPQPIISTGTRSVFDSRSMIAHIGNTHANHDDTRGSVNFNNINGKVITSGESFFKSRPVCGFGFYNTNLAQEGMRCGISSYSIAIGTYDNEDKIIMQINENTVQDHVMLNLEDDDPDVFLVIPCEDERAI